MSAWDCMQALQDKKRKAQQALERKQRRNAAMQAMLAKPGYQGTVLGSAIEVAHEDSDWILDGSQRCALKPSIGLLLSCCFVLPRAMMPASERQAQSDSVTPMSLAGSW